MRRIIYGGFAFLLIICWWIIVVYSFIHNIYVAISIILVVATFFFLGKNVLAFFISILERIKIKWGKDGANHSIVDDDIKETKSPQPQVAENLENVEEIDNDTTSINPNDGLINKIKEQTIIKKFNLSELRKKVKKVAIRGGNLFQEKNQKEKSDVLKTEFSAPNTIDEKFDFDDNVLEKEPFKIDFLKLNERKKIIGDLGEEFALKWEINQLCGGDLKKLEGKIEHVSKTNDAAGYDIVFYADNGSVKYIEVKTTTENCYSPFYLSPLELAASQNLNNYFIYRVYNFDTEMLRGNLYIIDCKKALNKHYDLIPSSFKVTPKYHSL